MSIESEQDLRGIERAAEVAREALAALQAAAKPGVSTRELDALCGRVFARYGAVSAPRLEYGIPVNAFISVNDAVVHGMPSGYCLRAEDAVTLDVTPNLNGYVADAARTVLMPRAPEVAARLVNCAEAAFWAAMRVTRAGRPLNAIGKTVERSVKRSGFKVLRELAGHSTGRAIHEEPSVLNFYHPRFSQALTDGLVLAVEPMVTAGRGGVRERADGVTIATADGSLAAHFENTVIVRRGRPLVLTAYSPLWFRGYRRRG